MRGHLGYSMHHHGMPVTEMIRNTFPASLELGCYALVIALLIGLTAGVTAACHHNGWLDHGSMAFAMAGICLPSFVLGPLLGWFFAMKLGWLNVAGWESASDRILPSITLGTAYAAW